jgi:hypothetical protein
MILFALAGPDRYELLIAAILEAIECKTGNNEKYESLITELNQSLTNRIGVQAAGDKLHRAGNTGTAVLPAAQVGADSFTNNPRAGNKPIQRIPQNMVSSRGSQLHYPLSKQPAGYDYLREANK